jgi:hypothetical protein
VARCRRFLQSVSRRSRVRDHFFERLAEPAKFRKEVLCREGRLLNQTFAMVCSKHTRPMTE